MWKSDDELLQLMTSELFTAVVGDVMDAVGLTHQFLPREIQPLRQDMVVAGRAMPVQEADCATTEVCHEKRNKPFGLLFAALDNLKQNEVYLCTGGLPTFAAWGGLMTTRALQLKAAGAVLNACSRDTREILALDFPTFSLGRYGQDQQIRGRVVDFRCPISFANGVIVKPGDLIFGDMDGVLTVPRNAESDVVSAALEKVRGESKVRTAIENGMSAQKAYDTYGIL